MLRNGITISSPDRRLCVEPECGLSAAAAPSTTRSPCWGPTSCSPTGTPADESPIVTVAAGERVMLNGYVNLTQL